MELQEQNERNDEVDDWIRQSFSHFTKPVIESHPGEEEIFAFYCGQIRGEDFERIHRHLLDCSTCKALFGQARAFSYPAQINDKPLTATQLQAEWQRLRALLPTPPPPLDTLAEAPAKRVWAASVGGWRRGGAIGLIGIALMVWAGWYARRLAGISESVRMAVPSATLAANDKTLARESAQMTTSPQPEVAKALVKPSVSPSVLESARTSLGTALGFSGVLKVGSGSRGEGSTDKIPVKALTHKQAQFTLRLDMYGAADFTDFQVELRGEGRVVRPEKPVALESDGFIHATFPTVGLRSGAYQVHVVAVNEKAALGENKTELAEGVIQLVFNAK